MPRKTRKALTATAVDRIALPATGQVTRFDALLPGFGIRASYAGSKSFIVMYRFGGKQRLVTLGRHPVMSLADARDKARETLAQVAQGIDPRGEVETQRMEATRAQADTYATAVAEFIEKHAKAKKGNRTWRDQQRLLLNADPCWLALPVTEISRRDVHDALDGKMADGKPYLANRTYAALSTFFRWLHSRDRVDENPMSRVPRPFDGEKPRDRVWTDDELTAIWKAADALDGLIGPYLRLLLLTGCRKTEVAGMKWSEIDIDKGVWTLPAERHKGGAKTGRDRIVTLPAYAVRILKGLPNVHGGDFVFPGRDGKSAMYVGGKVQARISKASGVADWTYHDARNAIASGMARLGIAPHVQSEILGHARQGVTARSYQHYDYRDEMREAVEAWAAHIDALAHPETNVVGLRG